MKNNSKVTGGRSIELQKEINGNREIYKNYVMDIVTSFVEEGNIFDTMRSLKLIKDHWAKDNILDNQTKINKVLEDINNIEALLIDLSEGECRCQDLMCKSYAKHL